MGLPILVYYPLYCYECWIFIWSNMMSIYWNLQKIPQGFFQIHYHILSLLLLFILDIFKKFVGFPRELFLFRWQQYLLQKTNNHSNQTFLSLSINLSTSYLNLSFNFTNRPEKKPTLSFFLWNSLFSVC
jgi:hypothetical protein